MSNSFCIRHGAGYLLAPGYQCLACLREAAMVMDWPRVSPVELTRRTPANDRVPAPGEGPDEAA
jgi:hypothetical protein